LSWGSKTKGEKGYTIPWRWSRLSRVCGGIGKENCLGRKCSEPKGKRGGTGGVPLRLNRRGKTEGFKERASSAKVAQLERKKDNPTCEEGGGHTSAMASDGILICAFGDVKGKEG